MIEVNYNDYKRILEENMRLIPENYKLKEDLEYSNYCNEQLRKKIINLEYKIATLDEALKGVDKE